MVQITGIEKGSYAQKAGVLVGDYLLSVNGNEINDVLDYRFYITEKKLFLKISRDGEELELTIKKKDDYDDIGLEFETYLMDKKQTCRNKCIFCFIDQNPHGMRKDIYFKDDDSRLSFFFGNYITLTNISEKDIQRIIKMRISPVNISVHTTNPDLRVRMMNNKHAGESLRFLDMLKAGDIQMNAQIVLCKNINDGKELEKSLKDLSAYYPNIESIAVVPSGLTSHRKDLYPLEPFNKEDARAVIALVDSIRAENQEKYGERLVQCSDEWYLTAELDLPDEDYYDGYPQLDNGVGSITSRKNELLDEIEYLKQQGFKLDKPRCVSIVTGKAAYDFMKESAELICREFDNLDIKVYCAINHFFGESITVAGLLTGSDMYECLKDKELGETLFIPAVTLRHEGDLFLDDMHRDELAEKLGVKIETNGSDGAELVRTILESECCDEY